MTQARVSWEWKMQAETRLLGEIEVWDYSIQEEGKQREAHVGAGAMK